MRKVKHDLLYISERLKERILNVFNAKQFYLFDRGHGNCPNSYTLYTSIEIAHYTYKYYTMMCPLILSHILNNIRLDMPVMYMMYLNKCIYLIFFFLRGRKRHILSSLLKCTQWPTLGQAGARSLEFYPGFTHVW